MKPVWYEDTPTVICAEGTVTYVNCTDEQFPKDEAAQEWLKRAQEREEWPVVVTRAVVGTMLAGVDEKAITAAKLDAATLDVAAPALGTAEEKEKAVAEKLAAVLPVAEFEKLAALQATVARDEKPPEDVKP